jgi:hypothetical protein
MKRLAKYKIFILLLLVFLGSMAVTLATDPRKAVHTISQYPAIGALLTILWKIVQDEIKDQREILKAEAMALNSLFAGSHYALRTYDKQLDFCEGYWSKALEIMKDLQREGQTPKLIEKANQLYTYRMEQAIWLTENMNLDLEGFEKAVRGLGVDSHMIDRLPVGEERSERVARMTKVFQQLISETLKAGKSGETISYMAVLKELQEILGISAVYYWRKEFLRRAADHQPADEGRSRRA